MKPLNIDDFKKRMQSSQYENSINESASDNLSNSAKSAKEIDKAIITGLFKYAFNKLNITENE